MSRKIWGAEAIGAAINRNPKQTYYLLNKGLIRSAQRIGTQWVADEDDLQREFSIAGQAQPQFTAREILDQLAKVPPFADTEGAT
jgi:hypothetical protein